MATLSASPVVAPSESTVTFSGAGYDFKHSYQIWVSTPIATVVIGTTVTADGNIVGEFVAVAHGDYSATAYDVTKRHKVAVATCAFSVQ